MRTPLYQHQPAGDGVKRVLMVAFHFPPFTGSSGVQRTLRFCEYLPENGWSPVVLTADPRIYAQTGSDLASDVPKSAPVIRAFGLDAARHLAVAGRHFKFTALPDRWIWWALGGIPAGIAAVRRYRPQVIWSTYPIATAHVIAWAIHRVTGLPWVADFRDPMIERNAETGRLTPKDSRLRSARQRVERRVAARAARAVFCTAGARHLFLDRYPDFDPARALVIPNGFDERAFRDVERDIPSRRVAGGPVTLLHSGVLYYSKDRDPTAFLDAIAALVADGVVDSEKLRVTFRASGHDHVYAELIARRSLHDIVKLEPALPYREALREMLDVDGLLLFQGKSSNPAIPAKVYEYLRAGRPIFALADGQGETARLLQDLGIGVQAPVDDPAAIRRALEAWLVRARSADALPVPASESVGRFSRRAQTRVLARTLDDALEGTARAAI